MYPLTDVEERPCLPAPTVIDRKRLQRPLRVCFLIDALARAGTETQLLALMRHLDRRVVAPYLCLLRGSQPGSRALEPEDIPLLRLNVGSLCRPSTLAAAWRFGRWVRRERIDVVQAYFPDSSYFGIPVAWLVGVPHRIRVRNNLGHFLTPLHRLLGRLLNWFSTLSLTNCQAGRRTLLAQESPHPDHVLVLENGVDLDRFLTLPAPAAGGNPRRVGVVANLRHVKGLDILLQAAALLGSTHPEVCYEVAGEGEMRPELQRQIQELGLAGRFLLRGAVTDVPGFLGRLDVAVLCSRSEAMSNALLEYMAAGRPIVATAVGAAAELIEDGRHGLLVPPGDAPRLAQALRTLLENPDLAWRLGQAARQRAQDYYSRQAMLDRFENFYTTLARTRPQPEELGELPVLVAPSEDKRVPQGSNPQMPEDLPEERCHVD